LPRFWRGFPFLTQGGTESRRPELGRIGSRPSFSCKSCLLCLRWVPADSRLFACKHGSASSQGEVDREGACKSMNHAQKHLAQANRHIAELTVQIARQRVIVRDALDTNQRSEMAESLLDALEGSLRIFERHRIFLLSCSGSSSTLPPGDAATGRSLSRDR
jgi:hypothetical protein